MAEMDAREAALLADGPRKASVVVTGAANGIGKSTAARLAATGWVVVGVDRDAAALEDAVGAVAGVPVAGDVRDNQVLAEARRTAEAAGELRAWVNNAGVVRLGPLHMMTPEVINETLDIDLRAVVFGAREALSSFLANGVRGSIVNVSSVHARGGFPGLRSVRHGQGRGRGFDPLRMRRVRPFGIRCNAVAPGAVNTNIVPSPPPSGAPQPADGGDGGGGPFTDAPGQRAEEIAEVVAFLIEGPAHAINGHMLAVDNGISAWNCAFPRTSRWCSARCRAGRQFGAL